MPYITQEVPADVVLEYKDITIYNVYKNDCYENGPRYYHYGYNEDCSDSGLNSFYIRTLPNYSEKKQHKEIITEAIDLGYLTSEGLKIDNAF